MAISLKDTEKRRRPTRHHKASSAKRGFTNKPWQLPDANFVDSPRESISLPSEEATLDFAASEVNDHPLFQLLASQNIEAAREAAQNWTTDALARLISHSYTLSSLFWKGSLLNRLELRKGFRIPLPRFLATESD